MEAFDMAMLVLRLGLGGVFLAHGIKHARGREKTSNWFESIGFRRPEFQWFASTATEIGVGVLLIAGLLTTLASAAVIGVMTVAFWTVHRFAGFWVTARPDEGWEFVFTLAVTAVALAIAGPGSASIDNATGLDVLLDGWWGAVITVGGVPVAFGQVMTFWRPDRG